MLDVALEFRRRLIGVDPVVLQVSGAPERVAGLRRRRLPRLPDADHPPRQQLGDRLLEHAVVVVDQELAELVLEVLVELGRVVVAELGADLEDYDLRGGLPEEPLDVGDDDVDGVGEEDAVADAAVLLDADVDAAGAGGELAVDGEGLALGEGAADEGDADFVGGGVVRPRPHDLVDAELLRI